MNNNSYDIEKGIDNLSINFIKMSTSSITSRFDHSTQINRKLF